MSYSQEGGAKEAEDLSCHSPSSALSLTYRAMLNGICKCVHMHCTWTCFPEMLGGDASLQLVPSEYTLKLGV